MTSAEMERGSAKFCPKEGRLGESVTGKGEEVKNPKNLSTWRSADTNDSFARMASYPPTF